jgi:hypothetical protein
VCCLFTMLALIGPRGLAVLWWLVQPARWGATFDTFIVPFLGFVFVPWTTVAYVFVAPDGVTGPDVLLLALAIAADASSWFGGAYGNRSRLPGRTYSA